MAATWTVVKFITDNSVEAVPTSWIADGKCAWPIYTKDRMIKAIRTCEPPMSCWNHHEIIPFRNATYNNYTTARQKTVMAEETSDLNSDCDRRRILKKTKTLADYDLEQSDDSSSESVENGVGVISELPHIQIERSDTNEPPINNGSASQYNSLQTNNTQSNGTQSNSTQSNSSQSNSTQSNSSQSNSLVLDGQFDKCTCCAIHKQEAAQINGFLKQIIRKLALMEMDICDIKKILDRTPVSFPEKENVWEGFETPFSTEEGLTSFEEFLTNEENMKKSITELSRIGGDNANEFMKRAISKLITHKLAAEYSWVGLKKKKIFSKLNISNLLIRSAQQNERSSTATIKEMEEGIKKFLRRAAERAIAEEKRLTVKI